MTITPTAFAGLPRRGLSLPASQPAGGRREPIQRDRERTSQGRPPGGAKKNNPKKSAKRTRVGEEQVRKQGKERKIMTLGDIMAMEVNGKYVDDSSSSSSVSSDSDDLSSSSSGSSSSSSSSSSSRGTMRATAGGRTVAVALSDSDADSDLEEPKALRKKRKAGSSPVKKKPTIAATKKKPKAKSVAPPPPPPPPPLSPPPPSAEMISNGSNGSSSSSSDSYSSDSSGDDFSDMDAPKALATLKKSTQQSVATQGKQAAGPAKKRKVSVKKSAAPVNPESLKVTLKLPPGFIAKTAENAAKLARPTAMDRGQLKVQVTNSSQAPKRQRTPAGNARGKATTGGAKTPSTGTGRTTTKKTVAGGSKKASTTKKTGATKIPDPAPIPAAVPSVQAIMSKLIPTGPTVPKGEVRGAKELAFVDLDLSAKFPEEVHEKDIPVDFNDQFAPESEVLRNLDLFFFCDENGNPISLEVLDKPKDQRPRIMGFGTVVQHLPPAERPLPVKYILPSPAFPSRSRKRPRADSTASVRRASLNESPGKQSLKAKRSRKKTKISGGSSDEEGRIFQGDGSFADGNCYGMLQSDSIFQHNTVYSSSGRKIKHEFGQFDGQSESESGGSDMTSDDEDRHSARSGSVDQSNGDDSELLSSASSSSSSSSSGSGSDDDEGDRSAGSIYSSGANHLGSNGNNSHIPQTAVTPEKTSTSKKMASRPSSNGTSVKSRAKRPSNVPSELLSSNPEVNELMRTDKRVLLEPQGNEDELNLMECGFRHPGEYRRMRVWLPEITDWCLDYSEGDPTLWVITPRAWYKIAGPLSGMLPHSSYREKFVQVRMLFEASYLVAYVLKEWLPINKKVSYRATLQQIVELSLKGRYRVPAWFLIENYHFIQHQICDLFPDKEAYVDSMFFKQLQRLSDSYKSREERVKKDLAEKEFRRVQRENERIKRKQEVESERQRWKDQREEERKQKEQEKIYPIEDLELLEEQGADTRGFPVPVSDFCGIDGHLLGDLIMAWQTISTFTQFVSLEALPLEVLVQSITNPSEDGTDIVLVQVFVAFLQVILAEKSFTSLLDDLVVEGNIKVSDLFVNTERTYGICERPYMEMLNVVTWQDILRQLMSKDLGIDASIGHVEALVGCEIVLQTLYMQTNSTPFNAPVDTTLKGLEDYPQIIKRPMDLGTIRKNLDSGGYEGPHAYEKFAADVRLVWENALLYNGEESEVGRAALALSDIFEQDYQRFVTGRIQANENRIEGCKKASALMRDSSRVTSSSVDFADIVYGLYSIEFHKLPTAYKIGALSWLCSEFLKLSTVRNFIESQVEHESNALRDHRKKAGDLDSRRKHSEKIRRENEIAFRKRCAAEGILPNSHNVFSDAIKRKHEFIAKYYEDLQAEKVQEETAFDEEKKTLALNLEKILESVVIRDEPVGRDRYSNRYWIFKQDTNQRLFIEKSDDGAFVQCKTKAQLLSLLEWLNSKGIREFHLLTALTAMKDLLLERLDNSAEADQNAAEWKRTESVEVNLFPLPGGVVNSETLIIKEDEKRIHNQKIAQQMMLCFEKHLAHAGTIPSEWDSSAASSWASRVGASHSCETMRILFAEVEEAIMLRPSGIATVRASWRRKRREWRLALEGTDTYAQLVFLLNLLVVECINVEAFTDLYVRLDRKEWMKLRAKECRNFIPEVGKQVVYFGDGHAQALKEDGKTKKKRFTQKSDPAVINTTLICDVHKISYHHGGGDPYALVVLRPIEEMSSHSCARPVGSVLCPQPSSHQRLSRVLLRVLTKLKAHTDSGPFLEPVSDRDFPEYKEIILHPMNLALLTEKVKNGVFQNSTEFLADVKLICSNCELFCEGRFPALPPLARNMLLMAEGLIKRSIKEIRVYEQAINGSSSSPDKSVSHATSDSENKVAVNGETNNEAKSEVVQPENITPKEVVAILRLENRLPEYVVDMKRYEAAISRSWRAGERFRMLFRNPQGFPGEYYGGVTAGSLPFATNGLLPWDALRVTWDEDDGSDDSRINPWEAELLPASKKQR